MHQQSRLQPAGSHYYLIRQKKVQTFSPRRHGCQPVELPPRPPPRASAQRAPAPPRAARAHALRGRLGARERVAAALPLRARQARHQAQQGLEQFRPRLPPAARLRRGRRARTAQKLAGAVRPRRRARCVGRGGRGAPRRATDPKRRRALGVTHQAGASRGGLPPRLRPAPNGARVRAPRRSRRSLSPG